MAGQGGKRDVKKDYSHKHFTKSNLQEKPVANFADIEDDTKVIGITETRTRAKNCLAESLKEENEKTVDEDGTSDDGQKDKPKPEKDVNLLIDNVQRKDAQSVVLLNIT